MSKLLKTNRDCIAQDVLKRLQVGRPLGDELLTKFILFLPELHKNSDECNGSDNFALLRHDVVSAYRLNHADRLIGFDLGACYGAISEVERVSQDYSKMVAKNNGLRNENVKLRELARFIMHQCNDGNPRCDECIDWNDGECVALLRMRELGVEVN